MPTTIRIGAINARRVRKLCRAISRTAAVPTDVRANADHWASAVRRRMTARSARSAAWFLASVRRSARYWGTRLEASI